MSERKRRALERVTRAVERVSDARFEYRASLVAGRQAGATLQELGEAAGTSKQAVRQVLERVKEER